MLTALLIVLGLVLLVGGAEVFVRGASALASRLGLSPLVVGLTVVSLGTSAPEIAVSVGASWSGRDDLAVANVVGSNIFNILAILGIAALVSPLIVERRLVRVDVPLMIGVSALFWVLTLDGAIARWEAGLLLFLCIGYTAMLIIAARRAVPTSTDDPEPPSVVSAELKRNRHSVSLCFLALGLGLMVFGARFLVGGATSLASRLGVSEAIIGLTIVAAGTSLPELATSVVAAARGQRDIAVGNVVGSCVFNVLAILGIAGLAGRSSLVVSAPMLSFDIPVMIAASVACLPIVFTGHRIDRREGLLFLAGYLAYLGYLVLDATGHDAIERFSLAVLLVGGPIAMIGVGVSVVRTMKRGDTAPDQ